MPLSSHHTRLLLPRRGLCEGGRDRLDERVRQDDIPRRKLHCQARQTVPPEHGKQWKGQQWLPILRDHGSSRVPRRQTRGLRRTDRGSGSRAGDGESPNRRQRQASHGDRNDRMRRDVNQWPEQIWHVRLLKCTEAFGRLSIVYTVTTDLGDTTCPDDLTLELTSDDHTDTLEWRGLQLVQKTSLPLSRSFSLGPPNALHEPGSLKVLGVHAVVDEKIRQVRKLGPVEIEEQLGESIEAHVWDGGLCLASAIASGELSLSHLRNVLELGSGTGLVGLTLATTCDCRVTLSDLPSAGKWISQNISRNGIENASFLTLDWASLSPAPETYDAIIMADVTYNEDSHAVLLATLEKLMTLKTNLIFASKLRHEAELPFIDMLKHRYEVLLERRVGKVDILVMSSMQHSG